MYGILYPFAGTRTNVDENHREAAEIAKKANSCNHRGAGNSAVEASVIQQELQFVTHLLGIDGARLHEAPQVDHRIQVDFDEFYAGKVFAAMHDFNPEFKDDF